MIPIVDQIFGRFSEDLSVDLGTANTLVAVVGKGVVIREPTIVCRHKKTKKILAIGNEAKRMLGRTPAILEILRPMRDGVISDFDMTLAMLLEFVRKIHNRPGRKMFWPRPRMAIGVPSKISAVEARAVLEAATLAGAREAFLIEEPIAAALGADLAVSEPVGSMIVDIGGGTCEIAIISLGGVVVGRSLKIGGDAMDRDIASYLQARWGLAIGERTAEEIKLAIGSAYPSDVEKEMVVRGRDLEKGLPRAIKVSAGAIREALAPTVHAIVEGILDVIEDAPPELAADILGRGIFLCGGGAKLTGLCRLISAETKMSVTLVDDPLSCVVNGGSRALANRALLASLKLRFGSKYLW